MKKEFSKQLVKWILIFGAVCVAASYILSALGKAPCETVTTAVIGSIITTPLGYFCKSAFEKNSRNKHHVDADGNKIEEENSQ